MSYDIYLNPSSTEPKLFGFGFEQAAKITGTGRVAQRFLKFLFTPLGSDPSGRVAGTVLSDLIGGNYPDDNYLRTVITAAVESAAAQVRGLSSDPYFEGPGLSSANILRIDITPARADIYIRLLADTGEVAELFVPAALAAGQTEPLPIIASIERMLEGL